MNHIETLKRLNNCAIAASDWLAEGCDIHNIPRTQIAALVAFCKEVTQPPAAQPAPVQEPTLQKQLDDAHRSRDFYKRRIDALQRLQSKMRDPERTIVCDILANGCVLEPAGDRYTPPTAPVQEPYCYHDGRNIVDKQFASHSDVFPLYTTQPAQPAVPEGWKLVPKTPTNEMTSAMADALEDPENERSSWDLAENMYRAMLAAAPKQKGGEA